MRRPEFIAWQARHPRGPLGWLIGRIMSFETNDLNRAVLEALELKVTDHILDVGFGPGRALERAAALVAEGRAVGIDFSATMVHMAARRLRPWIEKGRVKLELGDSACLPFADQSFDKAYSVHTIYFWANPIDQLREIRRVLKPKGRLAIGVRKKSDSASAAFPADVYTFYDTTAITDMLRKSGFVDAMVSDGPGVTSGLAIVVADAM